MLEKLIKLAGEGGVADDFTEGDEFPEERAGGARETEVRAGGAREAEEIADNFTEEDEFPEENAAVLEKLEKNGAFATLAGEGGVADKAAGGDGAVLNRAGGARKIREAEGVVDNSDEETREV